MKISFYYNEFLNEINKELSGGTLSLNDTVQILRANKKGQEYAQIIDWYYADEKMADILKISALDDYWEIQEKEVAQKEYENDKPFLETMTVQAFISELEKYNRLV